MVVTTNKERGKIGETWLQTLERVIKEAEEKADKNKPFFPQSAKLSV